MREENFANAPRVRNVFAVQPQCVRDAFVACPLRSGTVAIR